MFPLATVMMVGQPGDGDPEANHCNAGDEYQNEYEWPIHLMEVK
ncbi:MAG TPA: hypothetical protein VHR66_10975 [Gemmataceae bacterium]|jgi:hypothetical protein|nr:hypothetical protein [Gemmataceae bacterium]